VVSGIGRAARIFGIALPLIGSCISCAMAIVHFYGLHGATLWPYKRQYEQNVVIFRTALIATLLSSWTVWFGARKKHRFATVMLRAGLASQVTLTLYGIAGCGGVLGGDYHAAFWRRSSDFIFPSTFFAEYNFLTFIFQVAPVMAIVEGFILFLSLRCTDLIAPPLDPS
jgi:hypothetical protein